MSFFLFCGRFDLIAFITLNYLFNAEGAMHAQSSQRGKKISAIPQTSLVTLQDANKWMNS